MSIRNKIIKWLGGYTEEDVMNESKAIIDYSRIEKQLFPVAIEIAIDGEFYDFATIKHDLCCQIAEFMSKYHLVEYTTIYDEITNCYVVRAKAYVREP